MYLILNFPIIFLTLCLITRHAWAKDPSIDIVQLRKIEDAQCERWYLHPELTTKEEEKIESQLSSLRHALKYIWNPQHSGLPDDLRELELYLHLRKSKDCIAKRRIENNAWKIESFKWKERCSSHSDYYEIDDEEWETHAEEVVTMQTLFGIGDDGTEDPQRRMDKKRQIDCHWQLRLSQDGLAALRKRRVLTERKTEGEHSKTASTWAEVEGHNEL